MPKGGLARRATAITQLRQQATTPVLLLDSGNSIIAAAATNTSDRSQGALPVAAMNAMGYDAMALGSRDLGLSWEVVSQRFSEVAFPILAANIEPADAVPWVQPYLLRDLDGHAVAIIGLTSAATGPRAAALGVTLTVADAAESLQRTIAGLAEPPEVVIVLSNLDQQSNEALARAVPGLDAIIGAAGGRPMDATAIDGPAGRVVLHAAYVQGEYLGYLTLDLDAQGRVAKFGGRALPLDPGYADDPEVAALMQSYGIKP